MLPAVNQRVAGSFGIVMILFSLAVIGWTLGHGESRVIAVATSGPEVVARDVTTPIPYPPPIVSTPSYEYTLLPVWTCVTTARRSDSPSGDCPVPANFQGSPWVSTGQCFKAGDPELPSYMPRCP
jgi:hypothetical protein